MFASKMREIISGDDDLVMSATSEFLTQQNQFISLIESEMESIIPDSQDLIIQAMRYSVISKGKYLRPLLTIMAAKIFNPIDRGIIRTACAVELVHCYSLIHDDLPAMDDDDFRRGKPSCHIAFGEATAILAGDSLLTLAFQILADHNTHFDPKIRSNSVYCLANYIGYKGMAGGQMLDLQFENQKMSLEDILEMQKMKTGYLFAAAVTLGAMAAGATDHDIEILRTSALQFGTAYQIQDDLLDVLGSQEVLGKKSAKDKIAGKATIIDIIGEEKSKKMIAEMMQNSINSLSKLDRNPENIKDFLILMDYIMKREH